MSIATPPPSRSGEPDAATLDRRVAALTAEQRALLARRLVERREGCAGIARLAQRAGDGPCPLSSPQQRVWFLDRLEEGNPAYNFDRAVRIHGALGIPVVGQVMKNNPAWRRYQRLGFIVTSETDLRYEITPPTPTVVPPTPDGLAGGDRLQPNANFK
jgi:hypothetical protein